jgi:MYXO-CTERM domain-containing protein
MPRPSVPLLACALVLLAADVVHAEEPVVKRYDFVGPIDFFATGAPLAVDGPDADTTNVDMLLHPGVTEITVQDIPVGAVLRKALLYWGGSIVNDDCGGTTIDSAVTFAPPGVAASEVNAEVCYCSDAAAAGYDMQLCRADVSDLVGDLVGEYALDDFAALVANGTTNTASFSVVLVFSGDGLPARHIAIYDGLLTMWNQSNPSQLVVLDQILVDDPPHGDLTWYTLEGDEGGTGNESVGVVGKPGNLGLALGDAINPVDNPMNHTVNTSDPPQSDALGVDIDQFDISAALSAGDTSVETTYNGGSDKYWIAYNVVGVNIYAPVFGELSNKDWLLELDADQDGGPSFGDTIRYVIHLENTGNALGSLTLSDAIPAEADSWTVIDAGGGIDMSTPDTLIIEGLMLAPGEATDVIFDVVIAELPASTQMLNVADYQTLEGDVGSLVAPPVPITVEGGGESDTTSGDTSGTTSEGSTSGDTGDTSDSDSGEGESSGESGSEGGSDTSGSNDEVGESGGGPSVEPSAGGCACSVDSPTAPLALPALGLLVWIRRPRRL